MGITSLKRVVWRLRRSPTSASASRAMSGTATAIAAPTGSTVQRATKRTDTSTPRRSRGRVSWPEHAHGKVERVGLIAAALAVGRVPGLVSATLAVDNAERRATSTAPVNLGEQSESVEQLGGGGGDLSSERVSLATEGEKVRRGERLRNQRVHGSTTYANVVRRLHLVPPWLAQGGARDRAVTAARSHFLCRVHHGPSVDAMSIVRF